MVFISKSDRRKLYEYIFKEGVVVCKKNRKLMVRQKDLTYGGLIQNPGGKIWEPTPESLHPELPIPNLYVMLMLRTLKSKGVLDETFAWRHYYYILTGEGVNYLREYLGLPETVVPDTHKPPARPVTAIRERRGGPRSFGDEGRSSYRRGEGADFGGRGRGRGAPRAGAGGFGGRGGGFGRGERSGF